MPIVLYALPLIGGLLIGWVMRGAKEKQPPKEPTPPPPMTFR